MFGFELKYFCSNQQTNKHRQNEYKSENCLVFWRRRTNGLKAVLIGISLNCDNYFTTSVSQKR